MSHTECHTADTGLCSRELDVDFRFWSPACNGQSIFQIPLVMGWYHTFSPKIVYFAYEPSLGMLVPKISSSRNGPLDTMILAYLYIVQVQFDLS